MPDLDVFQTVHDDIKDGLHPAFVPAVEGTDPISHPGPFKDLKPITNGTFTTVVWEYKCKHVDWFQGIPPTGNEIVIRGTTIVDHRDITNLQLHRYIDWLGVLYCLGMTLYHRVMLPKPNYEAMNHPVVPFGPPKD